MRIAIFGLGYVGCVTGACLAKMGQAVCGVDISPRKVRIRKLNISPLYLPPGFAFEGPCLPKDLRALARVSRQSKLDLPLLTSILKSHASHLKRPVNLVLETRKRRIGIVGLAFKSQTDDLRESPAGALAQRLHRAKREVRIDDPLVQPSKLFGANRGYV